MSDYLDLTEPKLADYLSNILTRETPLQRSLREATRRMPNGGMITTTDEAQFLGFLIRLIGARRVLEIGTFTGYGTLAMALALPEGGRILALDSSKEWTDIARRHWKEAGVEGRIELRLAPAKDSLNALIKEGARFDFAFIDADKQGYDAYYEACLNMMDAGGVIAFDNMLWGGEVADPAVTDAETEALRNLNAKIRDDARVDMCLLTVADGLLVARKR
jgi:predicted O-methyltransferase YrrM